MRGVRRARACEEAAADPESAAWMLWTRTRHNEDGSSSLTISGPAELLPVIQAGIEAKRVQLQRKRQRDAAAQEAAQAETEAEAELGAQPEAQAVAAQPAQVDLDEQVPGWPAGTTVRDVRAATAAFFASVQVAGAARARAAGHRHPAAAG